MEVQCSVAVGHGRSKMQMSAELADARAGMEVEWAALRSGLAGCDQRGFWDVRQNVVNDLGPRDKDAEYVAGAVKE